MEEKKEKKEEKLEKEKEAEIKEDFKEEPKEEKIEEKIDVKVEEPKKEKKKKKKKGIYFVICLFIIVIFASLVVALNNVGLLDLGNINVPGTKKKVQLNYTTTNTKQKEGVYIIDVSDVVEEVMPSIVAITSKTLVSSGNYGPFYYYGGNQKQYTQGAGSGIIISQTDDELLILTNNHVVEDADELQVQFINEKSVDATVKGTSERKDVAIVSVKIKNLDQDTIDAIKIATIGDSSTLKVGNGIIAIGNALGYGQSVTAGVVSALNRDVTIDGVTTKMIQIDAAINGGNSGGALLNSAGEVVGINSAKYSSAATSTSASIEGMGFAIPISDVKELIEELMNGKEDTGNGTIGIEGNIVSKNNMPQGFMITKVEDNSGAEEAGLEVGNIITKIEGKEVTSFNVISNIIKSKDKGDTVKLVVSYADKKEYKEKEVEVTLK